MQETGTCPECNSSAISAQVNSGFKDLYKCESCGCILKSVTTRKLSRLVGYSILLAMAAAITISYFISNVVFAIVFFSAAILMLILQVTFEINTLFIKRSFHKFIKSQAEQ